MLLSHKCVSARCARAPYENEYGIKHKTKCVTYCGIASCALVIVSE